MSTSTDFKILEIPVDGVNSYIPPIIINEADNNGRHLKFTPTYDGQPVTGITSARMYYDPRPRDASSIGDYVDGTKDGDGWVFVIPPNTFTANVQGIASVSFTDSDGETYTRSVTISVESGGTKIDSQGTRIDRLIATLEQMVNDFTLTADSETGPAGSHASVNVTKLGNGSYKLDFTIPTGERGPKGDPGDLTTVTHEDTLKGDGTTSSPLSIAEGHVITNPIDAPGDNLNDATTVGIYNVSYTSTNVPFNSNALRGQCWTIANNRSLIRSQILISGFNLNGIWVRFYNNSWSPWKQLAYVSDIPSLSNYVPLSTYRALETRVKALEAKLENQ